MITNFESQTAELTKEEMGLLDDVIKIIKAQSKSNPIKSPAIVKKINDKLRKSNSIYVFKDVTLRKLVNYIRKNAMHPLIATSRGYYMSNDREEILMQIKSLEERSNSIMACADGLKKYLKSKK